MAGLEPLRQICCMASHLHTRQALDWHVLLQDEKVEDIVRCILPLPIPKGPTFSHWRVCVHETHNICHQCAKLQAENIFRWLGRLGSYVGVSKCFNSA